MPNESKLKKERERIRRNESLLPKMKFLKKFVNKKCLLKLLLVFPVKGYAHRMRTLLQVQEHTKDSATYIRHSLESLKQKRKKM